MGTLTTFVQINEHFLAVEEIINEPPLWEVTLNGVVLTEPCESRLVAQAIYELFKRALEAADHA